jgi:hypothetical protein
MNGTHIVEGNWSKGNFIKGLWKTSRYEGGWNGGREGQGTYISEDGTKYSGNWQNDEKHGYGKLEYPNGDVY